MQLDSEEQLKTIAGFVAELIMAIENRSPKHKETWPEWMARMHGSDLDEISEGRRHVRAATPPEN
jgi:hypothetical protein